MPVRFDYVKPRSLKELDEALKEGSFVISGGTVGVRLLKERVVRPRLVVDVSELAEAQGVRAEGDVVDIGAAVKIYALEGLPPYGAVSEMVRHVASRIADPAIRSMGSVGGNIALADPSNELPIPLILADAALLVYGRGSFREERMRGFIRGPHLTALRPGEVIVRVRYRELRGYRWAYRKHFIRNLDYYVGLAGALARVEGGRVEDLRVALGGEAVGGFRYVEPAFARGEAPGEGLVRRVVDEALAGIEPRDSRQGPAEYKLKVLRTIAEAVVRGAVGL